MNLNELPFENVQGSRRDHDVVIYALSTCGFCKRAISFLKDKDYSFKYIHLDEISVETKNEVKQILREKFKENPAFPFAVIDDKSHLIGFIQPDWEKTLGL